MTPDEAAEFNTAFLKDIVAVLMSAAEDASLAGAMAYGPPGSAAFFETHLPGAIALHEVWYPNFGVCLFQAMQRQFDAGHGAACVLNSDSPTLPKSLLIEMVEVLSQPGERAVLGPSTDGGYYLLACKSPHPRLFEDIDWSTEVVAAQTLERAAEIGLPVHVLPPWYDVDDCASILTLAGEVLYGRPYCDALVSSPAEHSRVLLETKIKVAALDSRLEQFIQNTAHLQGAAA